MQSAKDTFYLALRDRLAALNPERTVVIRGAVRPAIVVAENELTSGRGPLDTFVVAWKDETVDSSQPLPLHAMNCEIAYATRGTVLAQGMDRGRVLHAMDGELRKVLLPASAAKQNFNVEPPATMQTNVFWSQPLFGKAVLNDGQIARTVQLSVFALEEAGD